MSSSCTTLFSSTQLILHTTLCQHFLLLFLKRTFHVFRFTICCLVMKKGECREMQPEYAMNRKKTTMLYNFDTVIMQKNIFWTKKFLACNNRHVALFMLQKKCVFRPRYYHRFQHEKYGNSQFAYRNSLRAIRIFSFYENIYYM